MLATTLGIPFDADKDYNERKEQYLMGGEIVDTTSITMAATATRRRVDHRGFGRDSDLVRQCGRCGRYR